MKQLHNAQDAIEQAIEEGRYGNDDWREWIKTPTNELKGYQYAELFGTDATHQKMLDPLFWQALGKARGWNDKWPYEDSSDNAARWFDTRYHNGDEIKFWQSLP